MKPRQLAGLFLMLAGLATTTLALALLWLAPKEFVATALVSVAPSQAATKPSNTSTQFGSDMGFDQSEFERIQSKVVLFRVITDLDLQWKWAEQRKEEPPLTMDR